MKAINLFSGGKDSAYALSKTLPETCLIVSFHSPQGETQLHAGPELSSKIRTEQLAALQEKTGISVEHIEVGEGKDYLRDVFQGLQQIVRRTGADTLVTGDLWHPYTNGVGDMLAGALQVSIVRPAKEVCPQRECGHYYINQLLEQKIEAMICSVRKGVLPKNFVGRMLDRTLLDDLVQMNIDPAGESGEYQSLLVAAPCMEQKISIGAYTVETVLGKNGKESFNRMCVL